MNDSSVIHKRRNRKERSTRTDTLHDTALFVNTTGSSSSQTQNSTFPPTPLAPTTTTLPKTTTTTTTPTMNSAFNLDQNAHAIVVGLLIGLIVILCFILTVLLIPCIQQMIRRHASNDKRKIRKRYQTIDLWLISKVRLVLVLYVCV